MRNYALSLAAIAAAAALAGCKNDAVVLKPFCTAFATPAVTESCTLNCTIHSGTGGKEVDGDLNTAVEVDATAATTNDTVKFHVSGSGTVASGGFVGVFLTEPNEATHSDRTIRTYVGTTLQETKTGSQLTVRRTGGGTAAVGYLGFTTTKSFDTMEYEVTLTYPNTGVSANKVYELCADGDVDGG